MAIDVADQTATRPIPQLDLAFTIAKGKAPIPEYLHGSNTAQTAAYKVFRYTFS